MSWQSGNGGRGGPPDLDDLARQGKEWLGQIIPAGGPRGVITCGPSSRWLF